MNVPTGQYCPPSIGMVAAFKSESLAGIVGIRTREPKAIGEAEEAKLDALIDGRPFHF